MGKQKKKEIAMSVCLVFATVDISARLLVDSWDVIF